MKLIKKILLTALAFTTVMAGAVLHVSADTNLPQADPGDPQRFTISEPGTYTVTGTVNGTVFVDPGEGEVTLVLDRADIKGDEGPAILAVSGDLLRIRIKDETVNYLSDSDKNTYGATVYTQVDTIVEGKGCLGVKGTGGHGFLAKEAELSLRSGRLLILSHKSGIKSEGPEAGLLRLDGACVLINAKEGPIHEADDVQRNHGCLHKTDKKDFKDLCGDCPCSCGCSCGCGKKEDNSCSKSSSEEKESKKCCVSTTDTPGEIVEGMTTNPAVSYEPDYSSAWEIIFNKGHQYVTVSEQGSYIISGASDDGRISVSNGASGIVLVLRNLSLSNQDGAALLIGDSSKVKIIVDGEVVLADTGSGTDSAGGNGSGNASGNAAGDGTGGDAVISGERAALQAGDNSSVAITGKGKLRIDGQAKNAVAMGKNSSLVIDGDLEMDVTAAADGISSRNDVAVLGGELKIKSGEKGIHAEHILTVGKEGGSGPRINIDSSGEGMEAAVVNIKGGSTAIKSDGDGIDAEIEAAVAGGSTEEESKGTSGSEDDADSEEEGSEAGSPEVTASEDDADPEEEGSEADSPENTDPEEDTDPEEESSESSSPEAGGSIDGGSEASDTEDSGTENDDGEPGEPEVVDTQNEDSEDEGSEEGSSEGGADSSSLSASVNITGGEVTIEAGGSGIDSDGSINLIGGSVTIKDCDGDDECSCFDFDGELYIKDGYDHNCCGED